MDSRDKPSSCGSKSKADNLWNEGVIAFFSGNSSLSLRKFEASLEASDASKDSPLHLRCYFCACRLLDDGLIAKAVPLLKEAVRLRPEFCEAHVELCLILSSKDLGMVVGPGARAAVARMAAAAAIVEGEFWTDPWQRPAVFLPGLPSQPFWDAKSFPWIQELERNHHRIAAEVDGILRRDSDYWLPVGGEHRSSGHGDGDAVIRGSWSEIVLFGFSENASERGCAVAPITAGVVRRLIPEAVDMAEAGAGEVILSSLAPGSQVAPHCARTNHRLTVHLGIRVPSGSIEKRRRQWWLEESESDSGVLAPACGIRVGADCREWREGAAMVFDDSYEHEVWNDTSCTRIVLLIRFWHPALDADTKRNAAMASFEARLARSQRLQLIPPLAPCLQEPSAAIERMLGGSDGVCYNCGRQGMGGGFALDHKLGKLSMVMSCCGFVIE